MTKQNLQKEALISRFGLKMLDFLITKANRKKLSRYRIDRARNRMIREVTREQKSHLDDILRNVTKHIIPVTHPPVLISHVHHSGGELLNRLFDGHPEVNALPDEIAGGATAESQWPGIDLDNSPQDWFEALFKEADGPIIRRKFSCGKPDTAAVPFVFLPLIQEQIFLKYLESEETPQLRDVIDAYITSYFGAWLDYQNFSGKKKYTTACAAAIATQPESMKSFLDIYSAGKVIFLVRNPEDWLASVCTHEPEVCENAGSAVNHWKAGARCAMEINRKFGDRVCLIKFEDLIGRTDAVMRYLSKCLEISFEDILLKPTFNCMPLQPPQGRQKHITVAAFRYAFDSKALDEDHRKLIREIAQDDYQTILQEVVGV